MTMELKPGARFRSATSDTEIAVIKAPQGAVDLRIGGHPVVPLGQGRVEGASVDPLFDEPTAVGKRYTNDEGTIEVLCTKAGAGSISVGDTRLHPKDAKPLPSSD